MNNVQLVGRLYKDVEVRYTDGGSSIARFGIACNRRFKQEGQPEADFISCIAFGKTAEFIEKYFNKGSRIGIVGRIQTGSYTNKDGANVYTTDVVVENCEFVDSKQGSAEKTSTKNDKPASNDFMDIPDGLEEELPFN